MKLVEFLEARIAEHHLVGFAAGPSSLAAALLMERAQEREILAARNEAARAEGIIDPEETGAVGAARCSMLVILAAGYKTHADYQATWD